MSLPDSQTSSVPRCQAVLVWGPFRTTLAAGTVLGPHPAHAGSNWRLFARVPTAGRLGDIRSGHTAPWRKGRLGGRSKGWPPGPSSEDPRDTELTTRRRTCKDSGPELNDRTRVEGGRLFLGPDGTPSRLLSHDRAGEKATGPAALDSETHTSAEGTPRAVVTGLRGLLTQTLKSVLTDKVLTSAGRSHPSSRSHSRETAKQGL